MANGNDSFIHLTHTIWSGILTALGVLVMWNWNKLSKQVEGKADKVDFKEAVSELREGQKEIVKLIEHNNEIAKTDRHDLRNAITPIALDVAHLKGKLLKE